MSIHKTYYQEIRRDAGNKKVQPIKTNFMRDFLNDHRKELHAIIGFALAVFLLTLILGRQDWPADTQPDGTAWERIESAIDYYGGFAMLLFWGALIGGAAGFGIEELQLRQRKTNLGFDYAAIFITALGGVAGGMLFWFTSDDANDPLVLTLSGTTVAAMAIYYFWDYAKRKKAGEI